MRDTTLALTLISFLLPVAAVAQDASATATRIEATPAIDGRLDDAAWRDAQWISGFRQREPREGEMATLVTEVAFAYDDNALYVAARLHGDSAHGPRALVTRRDREGSSEQLVISLDTYHDRRTAYSFGVTAAGVRIDYFHPEDNRDNRDYSFDPVWQARVARQGNDWTAELRIPFSQLRFNAASVQEWGLNITRLLPALNEEDYWVVVGRRESGWASRFGVLDGLVGIRPARRIELAPYVATDSRWRDSVDRANPFDARQKAAVRAGADLKVGIGPSLTLDATFNPDFGQVEADPADVNLSAFETIFAERRPFFVEGSQRLRANGATWFYSRRIGAPPHGRVPADFQENVPNTTILGAAKITGRLPSRLSVGALAVVTDRERARGFVLSDQSFPSAEIEPLTGYGVVRLQQEFGRSASSVGVIATAVQRDFSANSQLVETLPRSAVSAAFDWNLRTANGAYVYFGAVGATRLTGDSLAITRVQSLSAHYFQRPDAHHVHLDRSARELDGWIATSYVTKNSGRLLWQFGGYLEAPGLDVNDMGRIGAADDRGINGTIRWRQTTPGKHLRNWEVGAQSYNEWNFGGIRQYLQDVLFGSLTLPNFWSVSADAAYQTRDLADDLTRGGPLMGRPAVTNFDVSVANNPARKTRLSAYVNAIREDVGTGGAIVGTTVSMRPGTRWELSLDPRYSHVTSSRQFVANLADGPAVTFGRRYVFSYIDRSDLSARIRLNYAITPDLTLETYAEPFVASGRYYDQGELPSPGSYALRRYGTDGTTARDSAGSLIVTDGATRFVLPNRDFTVASFRSNLVARWEWRPGSTLFLVWQVNRAANTADGPLVRASGWWDALTAKGENVVAVKVSYWIPIR
ncbi:MAG TPA: DUF5916 domain-containing protein [Gemmatimonadaceae bacterium]|nr:DUF5916 domain-containing protein [Gemmatimonadaceae bacterium]